MMQVPTQSPKNTLPETKEKAFSNKKTASAIGTE